MRQSRHSRNAIQNRQARHRRQQIRMYIPIGIAVLFGLILGAIIPNYLPERTIGRQATALPANTLEPSKHYSRSFSACGSGPRINCVVDGDTFWLDGTKIRIADIDTPEIHPSRCEREEQLGQAAKLRLLELLNVGPFDLTAIERDTDRYGRKLRIVTHNGTSLGNTLVREGFARNWDGHRHPWCD